MICYHIDFNNISPRSFIYIIWKQLKQFEEIIENML